MREPPARPALLRSIAHRLAGEQPELPIGRGFHERFTRLGSVVVWCEAGTGDARASLWINRSARIAVPERAIRATVQCLRADSMAH